MVDKRELILAKLKTILAGVPNILNVYRDRGPILPVDPETQEVRFPAAFLLDGNEVVKIALGRSVEGKSPPQIVTLKPEIIVVLRPRIPENEGVPEELSAFRIAVFKAINNNASLIALLGSNGGIEYQGFNTDMATGMAMEGQLQIMFDFNYTFIPDQL